MRDGAAIPVPLHCLVKFRNGADYKHVEDPDGSVPVIGSGGPFAHASDWLYDGESVLFGRKGTVNKPRHQTGKFWTVDTMYYTELGPEVDGRWLYYWASTVPYSKYLTDTALPSMTSTTLGNLRVPWMPVPHQRRIADFLDRETAEIDAMDAELDGLIALLDERKITHLRRLTTGITSADPSSATWCGILPKGWQARKVASLFTTISSGTTPSPSEIFDARDHDDLIPWVNTAELRESTITATRRGVKPSSLTALSALRLYQPGTLLIAMYGATIGRLGVLGIPACTNQACCAMADPVGGVEPAFVYYALWAARDYLILQASGGGQPNINQDKIRGLCIPLPTLAEQRSIVDELEQATVEINEMVADARRLKALLAERRSTLISEVVTGRKEVA